MSQEKPIKKLLPTPSKIIPQLPLLQGEYLANQLVLQGSEKARKMTAGSGQKLCEWLKRSNRVGYSNRERQQQSQGSIKRQQRAITRANTLRKQFRGERRNQRGESDCQATRRATESRLGGMVDGLSQWMDEPDIPRVATGVKNRVDRLKCLGNAVVPQQIYPILKAIAEIEAANDIA